MDVEKYVHIVELSVNVLFNISANIWLLSIDLWHLEVVGTKTIVERKVFFLIFVIQNKISKPDGKKLVNSKILNRKINHLNFNIDRD